MVTSDNDKGKEGHSMVLLFEPIIGGENNKGNDNIFRLGDVRIWV